MARIVNIEITVHDAGTYKRHGSVELKASEELFDPTKAALAIVAVVTTLLAAPAPEPEADPEPDALLAVAGFVS